MTRTSSGTSSSAASTLSKTTTAMLETSAQLLQTAETELNSTILGQQTVVRRALVSIVSGGHFILIGVPGLAKTKLVHALGHVLGLDSKRIQCTPDLMPADILGSEILEDGKDGKKAFRFIEGPIFAQLLMADEINRASPRTQSALLEAMQERRVTIAGQTRDLPAPFHVMATQNPLEQEGTYPLPEAQLDRFLMQIPVSYPDAAAERAMLIATTANDERPVKAVLSAKQLIDIQHQVRDIPIGEKLVDHIMNLVRQSRPETSDIPLIRDSLQWGAGPRAGQAFMLAARAHALIDGRTTPVLQDVLDIAPAVLRHRIGLRYAARAQGITEDSVIDELCRSLV